MKKIHYQFEDEIATITMDDGKANAMDFVFFEEMNKGIDLLGKDGAKILVFRGRPGYFSAGLDIKLMPTLSPKDLNALAETFARTLLRVFALPIPTIALVTGHAVAGGAMLSLSCDLRLAVSGSYRIQMNEMMTGIPFPSWMILIGRSAIPVRWLVETFLHARAHSPEEAVARGIFHSLIKQGEDVMTSTKAQAEDLKRLNMHAYSVSKNRMRATEIEYVLQQLKEELPFKQA